MIKPSLMNESLNSFYKRLTEDSEEDYEEERLESVIDEYEDLYYSLRDAVNELYAKRESSLKAYEIALQDAIEKIYPDLSWWEVTSVNIFMDLMNHGDPDLTVDHIMMNLTIDPDGEPLSD